jgi:hypothetical protein
MANSTRRLFPVLSFLAASFLFAPIGVRAQTSTSTSSTSGYGERWLHVRVISTNSKGETVRVNVPLDMAEKVLPAIDHDRLHNGKVRIGCMDCDGVDVRTLFEAVRTAKDGEYVTVQSNDADISVMKKDGQMLKVPMKVVEALLSGTKDELDIVAGLHALAGQGDVELVSVKDNENTIRVWLDSKNVTTD